jgi:pimeloyl-ACP methyl ester carboxylesterase
LIGAHVHADGSRAESRIASAPLVGSLLFKQLVGRGLFRAYFRRRLLGADARVEKAVLDDFYDAFNSPAARGSALAALRASRDTHPVIACTGRIQVPTLVVWGRSDAVYPPALAQRVAHEIRGAGLELVDTGHFVPLERPDLVAELIAGFVSGARGTG